MSEEQADEDLAEFLRGELVQDTATIVKEETERAKRLFRFDEEGNIHLTKASEFNLKNRILVYLIARQYAAHAGFIDEPTAETSDLADELGSESKTVSARLSELKGDYVESVSRGEYKIQGQAIPDVLDMLEGPEEVDF
jgi:hypothetical protein